MLDPESSGDFYIYRFVIEPHREYVSDLLYYGGRRFERTQRYLEADALAKGQRGTNLRTYRLKLAADGVLEEKYASRVRQMFDDTEMWGTYPQILRTTKVQAIAFELLSATLCMIFNLQQDLSMPPGALSSARESRGSLKEMSDTQAWKAMAFLDLR